MNAPESRCSSTVRPWKISSPCGMMRQSLADDLVGVAPGPWLRVRPICLPLKTDRAALPAGQPGDGIE